MEEPKIYLTHPGTAVTPENANAMAQAIVDLVANINKTDAQVKYLTQRVAELEDAAAAKPAGRTTKTA